VDGACRSAPHAGQNFSPSDTGTKTVQWGQVVQVARRVGDASLGRGELAGCTGGATGAGGSSSASTASRTKYESGVGSSTKSASATTIPGGNRSGTDEAAFQRVSPC
jgi:hypothetical protein